MDIVSYSLSLEEFQAKLNDLKDTLIEKINADHGLTVNPAEYMVVLRTKGNLGRFIDKLFGKLDADKSQTHLFRVVLEKKEVKS
jgi:hypothetical protein